MQTLLNALFGSYLALQYPASSPFFFIGIGVCIVVLVEVVGELVYGGKK